MSHFQLPEWRQLSRDEQIEIVNLPTNRTYVVRGGPGTGKSILAIHRAAKLMDTEPDARVKLIVYNKPLQLHLSDALKAVGLSGNWATTCHSWIQQVSGIGVREANGLWGYDWDRVRLNLRSRMTGERLYDHLILDEAQDIPRPLLEILSELSANATIFVDDRQAINDEARQHGLVGLASIRAAFDPEKNAVFDLSRNFRNSQEILDAAHAIRPLASYEVPDRAIRRGESKPLLMRSGIEGIVKAISTHHVNNPADRIGVAVPDTSIRWKLRKALEEASVPVQTFERTAYGRVKDYDPCAEGATILTYNVIKGLEFDAMFLPFLDNPFFSNDDSETRRNMVYVAATRARTHLTFVHEGSMGAGWLDLALQKACNTGIIRQQSAH